MKDNSVFYEHVIKQPLNKVPLKMKMVHDYLRRNARLFLNEYNGKHPLIRMLQITVQYKTVPLFSLDTNEVVGLNKSLLIGLKMLFGAHCKLFTQFILNNSTAKLFTEWGRIINKYMRAILYNKIL